MTREEVNKKSVMRERDELQNVKNDLESKLKHGALNLKKTNEQLRETMNENQSFKIRIGEMENQLKGQAEEISRTKHDKAQIQDEFARLNIAHHQQSDTLKVNSKHISEKSLSDIVRYCAQLFLVLFCEAF